VQILIALNMALFCNETVRDASLMKLLGKGECR
jgi:hypothetical protein